MINTYVSLIYPLQSTGIELVLILIQYMTTTYMKVRQ
jgi:hypothetical protein